MKKSLYCDKKRGLSSGSGVSYTLARNIRISHIAFGFEGAAQVTFIVEISAEQDSQADAGIEVVQLVLLGSGGREDMFESEFREIPFIVSGDFCEWAIQTKKQL